MKHHANAATAKAAVFETTGVGVRGGRGKIFMVSRETGDQSQRARDAERNLLLAVDKYDVGYARLRPQAVDDETRAMLAQWKSDEQRTLRQQAREARELVNADRAGTANARSKLFALPADHAQAREIRDKWPTLPEEMRKRLREKMTTGEHDEWLTALANDPFREVNPDSQFAAGLWTQRVQREHADELAALDEQDAGASAIEASITSLETVIDA